MPEGPEVKLSADIIRPLIKNHILLSVDTTSNGRYAEEKPEGFLKFKEAMQSEEIASKHGGMRVLDVSVRGKFMYWTFPEEWYLFSTFGMTGQWSPKQGNHPCISMTHVPELWSNGIETMFFNDPRHFGTVKFVQGKKKLTKKLDELGWDPLSMSMEKNLKWIEFQLSQTTRPIAEVLMDQGIFSGVGNYIRAEALYSSKISPWRQANKLTESEIVNLCKSIIDVMQESYNHQGATIQTYKTPYGEEGNYSTLFKVYGQEKDPLGNKIITQKIGLEKRTIHWCPDLQK